MIRPLLSVALFLGLLAVMPSNAVSQEPHHPEISIAHQGIARLKSDIKLMLDLATKEERHWENWDGVIELFAFGMDYDRPIRVDILTGLTPAPLMIYGPYTEPENEGDEPAYDLLHENLESADYVPSKVSDTLYELLPPEQGWFRILPKEKYAILTLSTDANHNLLKQLILKAVNPTPVILEVLAGEANVGVQLVNKAHSAEDQKKRSDSFNEIRAVRTDSLQKRPQETATEFEIRKGILSVYLDELERLMVEVATGKAQAFLNVAKPNARVSFDAAAIKESALAKSLELYGKQKDAFASVKKPEGSALSIRINHPIDELRQKNTGKIVDLLRADLQSKLKATDNKMSDEEKDAGQKLFDGIMEVLQDGVAQGNLNAFIESVPDKEGKFVSWGASAVKDAKRLETTLALISKTGDGNEVSIGVDSAKDVSIHRIKLRKEFLKIFDDVFGAETELFIGTSESMVWFAIGPKALASLKAAIEALGDPADSDVILNVDAEVMHWARRAKQITEALPKPGTVDEEEIRRNVLLRLTQATESLKDDDDDLHFKMTAADGKVSGVVSVNTGILRFIGTQLEKFSTDSLE